MKRFTKVMKLVTAAFALALICVLGSTAEAAPAKFKPGTVYVFPGTGDFPTTTKNQYYSVKKYRMSTYSDQTITVIHPKDTAISVSSSKKKKLQATVTSNVNENITSDTGKKVYATPNATSHAALTTKSKYTSTAYYMPATNKYYMGESIYDKATDKYNYTHTEASVVALSCYAYYYVTDANHTDGGYWTSGYLYKELATGKYYKTRNTNHTYSNGSTVYTHTFTDEVTAPYLETPYCQFKYVKDNTVYSKYEHLYVSPEGKKCYRTYDDDGKMIFTPVNVIVYETGQYYLKNDEFGGYKVYSLNSTTDKRYYYKDYDTTAYNNTQTVVYNDGKTPDYEYAVSTIHLTSTTAGKYTVTIKTGSKKTKVSVLVSKFGNSIYTQAKLGKNTISKSTKKDTANNTTSTYSSNYQVSSKTKSAKLKFTANKNIKITGIVTAYIDKNGKVAYKKGKNGSSIPLSQAYSYDERWSPYGDKYKASSKSTFVYISYQDTFLKTSCTYSITKKNGVKKIKEVYKGMDGKKRTRYYDYGSWANSTMELWSY